MVLTKWVVTGVTQVKRFYAIMSSSWNDIKFQCWLLETIAKQIRPKDLIFAGGGSITRYNSTGPFLRPMDT